MKILVSESSDGEGFFKVDFFEPVHLEKAQQEKFVEFMRTQFDSSIVEPSEFEVRTEWLGERLFSSRWTDKEVSLLLTTFDDISILKSKLGRTWMGVQIQRGKRFAALDSWMAEQGIDPNLRYDREMMSELVSKFLAEERKKLESRKLGRKREILRASLPNLDKIIEIIKSSRLPVKTKEDRKDMKEYLQIKGFPVSGNELKQIIQLYGLGV
ncbi:MAG: hypothetical protein V1847_01640 [Candidatus Diapherotrites archaeon]